MNRNVCIKIKLSRLIVTSGPWIFKFTSTSFWSFSLCHSEKEIQLNDNIWCFHDCSWWWRCSSPISFRLIKGKKAIIAVRKNALAFPSMRFCRLLRRRQVFQVTGTSCPGRCLGQQQGKVTSFDLFTAAKCEFFPCSFWVFLALWCACQWQYLYTTVSVEEKSHIVLFMFFF